MTPSNQQFGLLVAYLLPGFIALGGVALLVPTVAQWLRPVAGEGTSGLGPPVYAVLAATAAGMIVSCFRWLLVDHALFLTGVPRPQWDADRLEARLDAVNYFVEYHYRYYQFYANTLVAVLWTYTINRAFGTSPLLGPASDLGVLIIGVVLVFGSRDALWKYHERTNRLIGRNPTPEQER